MTPSKHFAAPDTGSRSDPFRTARLRLTLLYLALITAIVVVLSASLYEFHSHDVEHFGRDKVLRGLRDEGVIPGDGAFGEGPGLVADAPSLGEYLERLGRSILFADIITIIAGGALSWLLASRTLRPVKEAVENEQRFFANAAHDLRTPLSVMRAEAEVALRSGKVEGTEAHRVLSSTLEEIDRMSAMVEQMLELARGGRAGPPSATADAPLDLSDLARNVASRMSVRARERGVELTADAPGAATVHGDPLALERAVSNIVENAISYTPSGGTVAVRVASHGGHVELRVTDTGIGIERRICRTSPSHSFEEPGTRRAFRRHRPGTHHCPDRGA